MDVLLALLGAAVVSAAAPPSSCQVFWEDGHLEIEADRAIVVRQFRLRDPERRILDLVGADLADLHTPGSITVGAGGVRQVRIARHPDKREVRIVFDLEADADLVLKSTDGGRRLIAWPGTDQELGPPAPGTAAALVGPPVPAGRVGWWRQAPGTAGVPPASFVTPHDSRQDAGTSSEIGPPAPASPFALVGPPAPRSALALVGPPAPASRWRARTPSGPAALSLARRLTSASGTAGSGVSSHVSSRVSSGGAPRFPTLPPIALPSPSPDEIGEASGSRGVPWPAAPQVVESIRLRRNGTETTLEIRSKAALMAWVQDEWQGPRLTVRIPRSSVACDVPRPRGAVERLTLRREEDAWALALDLDAGRHVFEAGPIEQGRGLRIRMKPAPALSATKPLVIVDAGHGGYDPGALGPTGVDESKVTFEVARLVAKALSEQGVQPLLTRTLDAEVRLQDRVALMDRFNPVAFVSLHCNSSEAPEATGIETYFRHDSGQKLASTIHEKLVGATGRQDRGVRSGRLYVLRGDRIPATLVEMGFMSSREEESRLTNPDYQKLVARAIADGIKTYLDNRPATSAAAPTAPAIQASGN